MLEQVTAAAPVADAEIEEDSGDGGEERDDHRGGTEGAAPHPLDARGRRIRFQVLHDDVLSDYTAIAQAVRDALKRTACTEYS